MRGICKLYTTKVLVTATDILNDRVLPFFEDQNITVMLMLADRGTEFCGNADKHQYQLYLQLNDIEHTKTKAKSHKQTASVNAFANPC